MLGKVKSKTILKITIFEYILIKRKLQILKYNNQLKNKTDINIGDYIRFSGRHIIYMGKGKGKEYNNYDNKLIYEGEYSKGERNGKGKEYDNGELIFEGDYLNGKRNGKGKEYADSKLIFEGDYMNGKRNGKGKEYDNGELIFDGDYIDGKICNGIYKQYDLYSKRLLFEIEYKQGEKNGKGKEYNNNGELIFEGEYLYNHKKSGKEYINNRIEYEGEFLFDRKWNGIGYDENKKNIYELINGNGKKNKRIFG